MQNFKNFKLAEPTVSMLAKFMVDNEPPQEKPLFLVSEEGIDWYDAYQLFDDMTVKIMYDQNGIIRSVVSEPVPQRDYTYAASMFFPEGMSVAEIPGDLPEGFEIESATWVFDGETVYQSPELVEGKYLPINTDMRRALANTAAASIDALRSAIELERQRDGDAELLEAWKAYILDLRDMTPDDLRVPSPVFPVMPGAVF